MLHALDHLILAVSDLEAATSRYAQLLGRAPSWRGLHPASGSTNTLFRIENTYLELLSPQGDGAVGNLLRAWLDSHGEGLLGLAFATADAARCRTMFEERGLAPAAIENGLGRDDQSGAIREWLRVPLPAATTRGVLIFAIEHRSPEQMLAPAGPLAEADSCVHALDHVVVRSAAPEATRELYGERLGLRLALDREFPQWGARLLFFRVGGLTVEIAASLEAGTDAPDPARDELWGLSFRVRDADAARARLCEAGFDVSKVRKGRREGTRVFTVQDPPCGVPTLMLEPPGA